MPKYGLPLRIEPYGPYVRFEVVLVLCALWLVVGIAYFFAWDGIESHINTVEKQYLNAEIESRARITAKNFELLHRQVDALTDQLLKTCLRTLQLQQPVIYRDHTEHLL